MLEFGVFLSWHSRCLVQGVVPVVSCDAAGLNQNQASMTLFYDSPAVLFDIGLLWDVGFLPLNGKNKMSKPKLGLQFLTPDETIALANTIITAMTGNANFTSPAPNPTLASTTTLKTTAATKLAAYDSALAAT